MAKLPMPFNNPRTYAGHSGIDFPQARGTRIPASGPGVVLRTPYTAKGGYWTTIKYDNGYTIGYAHQDRQVTVVRPGQRVNTGQTIGYVGSLGQRSTGPHLHIENIHWATEAGIWACFDRNRVVGSGSTAGGSTSGTTSGKLAEDGKLGPATVRALQKVLGVTQDGAWGAATTTALQKRLIALGHKISADGKLGPATIRALQTFLLGAPKADGIMGPETIRGLQHYLNNGGTFVRVSTAPAKLTEDGIMGPTTVTALQKVLGVTADGKLGPNTIKALQTKLVALGHKISVDGQMGPATIRALQTFLLGASKADGILGPVTIKALQHYLNEGGKFVAVSPAPAPTTTTKLVVDGQMGPATIKALQTKLGVTADGKMGPNTIKALQKALGQTQDGNLGPITIKALQMNVGSTVDGSLGPATIRALQTFLNAGKNFSAVKVAETPPAPTYPKPASPTYPGAAWWGHSPNSSPRREGDKVQYFVVHHAADTNSVEVQRTRFMTPNDRNVSPNWLIGKDGSVSEIVPPDKYRAWTTGAFDYNAVTVETQNSSGSPTWGITEESHVAIAKLVAWASKRYGFPIDRQHVLGHREVPNVPATACPGPSMDMDKIVTLAKKYAAETTPTEPTPTLWKIEIPRDEAEAAGKALDEAIAVLTQFRKLLP